MSVKLRSKLESFLPLKQFIFVLCFSLISMIMFCHVYDAPTLITWWTTFLDCVFGDNIAGYQHALSLLSVVQNYPLETNYPLFLNILFSIYILPVYVILHIIQQEAHMWIYILWIKLFLLVCNLAVAKVIQLILEENHINKETQKTVALIYLLSPFVQFYNLGMGQIDAFGLLFALLCFLSLQRNNYTLFIVFSVISILLKPFVIFIIAPLLIAMWHRKKLTALISGGLIILLYFLQNWVADILIEDYSHGSEFWNILVFYPRLMKYQIVGIPIVIILLVLICLFFFIWGYFREINLFNILLCQATLLVVFETLITQHPQWYIYFAAVGVMLLAFCNNNIVTYSLWGILELVFCFNGIINFDDGYIVTSYGEVGLLGKIFKYNGFYAGDIFYNAIPHITTIANISLILASIIFLIYALWQQCHTRQKSNDNNPHILLLSTIMCVPTFLLSVFVIIGYVI